jgi:hypothetical protein
VLLVPRLPGLSPAGQSRTPDDSSASDGPSAIASCQYATILRKSSLSIYLVMATGAHITTCSDSVIYVTTSLMQVSRRTVCICRLLMTCSTQACDGCPLVSQHVALTRVNIRAPALAHSASHWLAAPWVEASAVLRRWINQKAPTVNPATPLLPCSVRPPRPAPPLPGAAATQWYWGPTFDISTAEPGFFS